MAISMARGKPLDPKTRRYKWGFAVRRKNIHTVLCLPQEGIAISMARGKPLDPKNCGQTKAATACRKNIHTVLRLPQEGMFISRRQVNAH